MPAHGHVFFCKVKGKSYMPFRPQQAVPFKKAGCKKEQSQQSCNAPEMLLLCLDGLWSW